MKRPFCVVVHCLLKGIGVLSNSKENVFLSFSNFGRRRGRQKRELLFFFLFCLLFFFSSLYKKKTLSSFPHQNKNQTFKQKNKNPDGIILFTKIFFFSSVFFSFLFSLKEKDLRIFGEVFFSKREREKRKSFERRRKREKKKENTKNKKQKQKQKQKKMGNLFSEEERQEGERQEGRSERVRDQRIHQLAAKGDGLSLRTCLLLDSVPVDSLGEYVFFLFLFLFFVLFLFYFFFFCFFLFFFFFCFRLFFSSLFLSVSSLNFFFLLQNRVSLLSSTLLPFPLLTPSPLSPLLFLSSLSSLLFLSSLSFKIDTTSFSSNKWACGHGQNSLGF